MEAQTILCPHCQTPNPAKNLYCLACGKPLIQAVTPAPPTSFEKPPAGEPEVSQNIPPAAPQMPVQPPPFFPPTQGLPPQAQETPIQGPPQPGYPPQGQPPQSYPPQQAYYPPPPPPPPPAAPSLERLGVRVDGWADLVPGQAAQALAVEDAFTSAIKDREIPQVTFEKVEFGSAFGTKSYRVVRSPAGAIAVYIGAAGKDLSVSWSVYTRQNPNWPMIAILLAIAFGISFLTSLGSVYNFGVFFVSWVFGTFRWILDVAVIAIIAGYIWKGSFWFFLRDTPGEAAKDEQTALAIAVHQSLLAGIEKAGIDVSKLREKKNFRSGDHERKV